MNGRVILRPISLAHIQVQMTAANQDKCSLEAGTKKLQYHLSGTEACGSIIALCFITFRTPFSTRLSHSAAVFFALVRI
jgi:hypothetical protein